MNMKTLLHSLLIAFFIPVALYADDVTVSPELINQGWEEIVFDNKKPNHFTLCPDHCIQVSIDNSVSMIGKEIRKGENLPKILTWQWKIDQVFKDSDLSIKGKDDRMIALYIAFPYDPDNAGFSEKLMRPFVELLRGKDTPGRGISYVWGGNGKRGEVIESPWLGSLNAIKVLRTNQDETGLWLSEAVNIIADHQLVFGNKPKSISHILISADADDSQSQCQSYIRRIDLGSGRLFY